MLIDVVKDVAPMQGRRLHLSVLGVRHAEAGAVPAHRLIRPIPAAARAMRQKALMAAAGYKDGIKGLDFLIRRRFQLQTVVAGDAGEC